MPPLRVCRYHSGGQNERSPCLGALDGGPGGGLPPRRAARCRIPDFRSRGAAGGSEFHGGSRAGARELERSSQPGDPVGDARHLPGRPGGLPRCGQPDGPLARRLRRRFQPRAPVFGPVLVGPGQGGRARDGRSVDCRGDASHLRGTERNGRRDAASVAGEGHARSGERPVGLGPVRKGGGPAGSARRIRHDARQPRDPDRGWTAPGDRVGPGHDDGPVHL